VHAYHAAALAPDFAMGAVTATNGIPLAWFDAAGIPRDPAGDPDGDDVSNRQEWRTGTDPLDPRSHPAQPTRMILR
ncbi:MAG: hypothetical protein IJP66_06285, partial [Kiritimatiellae bacterium]|nr:hypothetical protein [Kiritimatiellia bacterium]